MTAKELLLSNFDKALKFLSEKGKEQLKVQGHFLSGNLERSFEERIKDKLNGVLSGEILVNDYGIDLDLEPSERVKKLGSFQSHVTELYNYFQKRAPNLTNTQRYFFAVNTAKLHFKGEIPTKNSYRYSNNGRRTGWINEMASVENVDDAMELINLAAFLQLSLDEAIEQLQREIR